MRLGLWNWFSVELEASECAELKQLLVDRTTLEGSECEDFCRLLWMCRIIAADQRVVWEHLSASFTDTFRHSVDQWNEQLAVKVLRARVDSMDDAEVALQLREKLERHLTAALKPMTATLPRVELRDAAKRAGDCPYMVVPAAEGAEGSLVCSAPLPAFGELLRIPRERMFFVDTVVKYSELGRAVQSSAELSSMLNGEEPLLVLALIYERHVAATSHWSELLASCPSVYPTVPGFWDWDDLAELEGLDILDDVLAKRAQLVQFHEEIKAVLPFIYEALEGRSALERDEFLGCFTVETVMWARATFDSRAFNLNIDGRVVLALVPVADMINHGNRSNVLVRKVEPDGGDFVMQVGASLTAEDVGLELWMSYGPLQNWELLQFYGFVIEDNEHDKLPFPFNVPESDTADVWEERRASLVAKYGLHLVGRCWIGYDGCPPAALIALLRVHLAEAEEFDMMERNSPFAMVGADTERRVVDTVSETIHCILELSGTSLEEDERLLEADAQMGVHNEDAEDAGALSNNRRLGIVLRLGLKRIAYRTLEWCAAAFAALETENSSGGSDKHNE
ncbi:SET domain containing protein [Trypanosoma grayi]|uniref:SET domain containing protein n=1 Tax=Trypanosoma grayi TaxID=71804 RepID=UPI0004F3F8A7|nr:SET domain containing protein [Trypanosoma grayi]KEG10796.1 SET domain containing protein [Trypanosoma grayi]